jgi:hypothetical protein
MGLDHPQKTQPAGRRVKRIAAGMILIFGALYTAACGYLWAMQPRLIFKPRQEISEAPADYGLAYEDVFVTVDSGSAGGERMHAWWIPHDGGHGLTLLYLHGAALNIGANCDHARRLHDLGFNVLLISYRGFGRSEGQFPSEQSVYQDAAAAWDYLTRERGIDPRAVIIYGHSLGGAVAIDLAVRYPDAAGLIVEASFTSMRALADTRPKYRIFPIDLILHQDFNSIAKVGNLQVPILYLHGTADGVVPPDMSRELSERTASPYALVFIDGGGHNNSARIGGKIYIDAVREFIESRRS